MELIRRLGEPHTRAYEDALKLATRFMDLHRIHWPKFEGECELRPFEAGPEPAK